MKGPYTFSVHDDVCEGGGLPFSPDHVVGVDAIRLQLRHHAIADAVVPNLGNQVGLQAQPCSSREGVGAVATTLCLLRQGVVTVCGCPKASIPCLPLHSNLK